MTHTTQKKIRTNSKEFNKIVFDYILNAIDPSNHNIIAKTSQEKLHFVWNCFNSEFNHDYNKKAYPNAQKRLAQWFTGLPSSINIDFENYRILELAKEWGTLAENATKKQEDAVLNNWFMLMAFKLGQLFTIYKVHESELFLVGQKVIVNTGGNDSPAIISDKNKLHGYKWERTEGISYLCQFENKTAQYIPQQYIRANN